MAGRFLVLANQSLGGAALTANIAAHAREGAEIHVVVPADRPADHAAAYLARHAPDEPVTAAASGDVTVVDAFRRLEAELDRCWNAGVAATGEVGVPDPMEALRDAVRKTTYTGLLMSTPPAGASRWLRRDLPHRASREFRLPVEWVEARSDVEEPTSIQVVVPAEANRALLSPRISGHVPPMSARVR